MSQQETKSQKIYQALGLIFGEVKSDTEGQLTIQLEEQTFNLMSFKRKKGQFSKYIAKNPGVSLYLTVYPQSNLSTGEISFHIVSWNLEKPANYQVNQFLLAGTWQLLPRFEETPVITIYRNQLKPWEDATKVRYNHVPVTGFTEPPFKFDAKNPNADEQKFYELLTQFNPQKKEFQFQFLLGSCSELPPRIKKTQANPSVKKPQPNGKKNKPQPNLKKNKPQPNLKKKKLNKQKPVKTQKVKKEENTKELLTVT